MKRILFISYTNFFGGAEYVLWDYLKRIDTTNIYIYIQLIEKKSLINIGKFLKNKIYLVLKKWIL